METLSKIKIKWIRSLRQKKSRQKEGYFVVEGEKMVLELVELFPEKIKFICTLDREFPGILCYQTDERGMKEISSLQTPNKLVAVVEIPSLIPTNNALIVALDGVQDPGNMGTIIRTADWFGVQHIVCSKETVDCFNSKVVQASMGSIFRVSVEYVDLANYLASTQLPVIGAVLDGDNMYTSSLPAHCILLMGNEGNGINPELLPYLTNKLLIPRYGNAESLNVSIATGIILAELTRNQFGS